MASTVYSIVIVCTGRNSVFDSQQKFWNDKHETSEEQKSI